MKKIYCGVLLSFLFFNLHAQNFDWAKREGLYEYDYGYGITTDNAGNIYVAGKYEMANANFSDTLVPCQGNHDIFLAQYSPVGVLNWIRTAGGTSGDYAWGVACDNTYLYIAGEIEGTNETIVFPGSPITLTCLASNDIFLAKYDLAGTLIWARSITGYEYEKALSVTYDAQGNVYICGLYQGDITFGGTTTISPVTIGVNDIFVAKYDMDGNFMWVQHAGSAGRDEAKSIQCDASGSIYICGLYSDGCNFGSTTLNTYGTLPYFDAFIAKYYSDGTLAWVKTAGGDYDDVAWSLTIDNAHKLYITGEYNAYAVFETIPLTTTGMAEVFVASYDTSGTIQWAVSGGGPLIDRARGIGTDGTELYITGQFGSTANFGSHVVISADSSDVFIARLSNTGTFLNAVSIGGPADAYEDLGYESGIAICADATGHSYATGSILDGGDFGTITYNAYSRTDAFVTKMSNGPDMTNPSAVGFTPADNSTDVVNGCNVVLTFNEAIQKGTGNIILKEGGVVTQTIDVMGANVTVAGNIVTINPPTDFTDSALVNVEMAAGVFQDMSNNNFAGVVGATTWNFSIQDTATVPISVAEHNSSKSFRIYPNPGTGIFTIDLNEPEVQNAETVVYNYMGQIVNKRTDRFSSKTNMDLSALAKGIYLVEITFADKSVSRGKIVLQ